LISLTKEEEGLQKLHSSVNNIHSMWYCELMVPLLKWPSVTRWSHSKGWPHYTEILLSGWIIIKINTH